MLVNLYLMANMPAEAAEQAELGLRRHPGNPELLSMQMMASFWGAVERDESGLEARLADYILKHRILAARYPDKPLPLFNLARLQLQAYQDEQAYASLRRYLALRKDVDSPIYQWARQNLPENLSPEP